MTVIGSMAARLAALAWCASLLAGLPASAQQPAAGGAVPAVTVVRVERRDVTPQTTFTGRVEAIDKVELRARVEGFLENRPFEEGASVEAGALLFVLEKAPYRAKVAEAEAAILAAEGTLKLADIEVERQKVLVQRQATAQAKLDEAIAKQAQARGALLGHRAALDRAELELSYTDVRSPVAGRIGRASASVGDLVGPASPPLATVVSQDPIYVTFPASMRQLLEVRRKADERGTDPRAVRIGLKLADGRTYSESGYLDFVDVQVDPGTDSVLLRARMPNPRGPLVDGALVTVLVETAEAQSALLLPQSAVQFDQAGRFVLVVGAENKVQVRRIRVGPTFGLLYAVEEGLEAGDRVITDGIQKVRPGIVVAPTEAPLPPVDSLAARS